MGQIKSSSAPILSLFLASVIAIYSPCSQASAKGDAKAELVQISVIAIKAEPTIADFEFLAGHIVFSKDGLVEVPHNNIVIPARMALAKQAQGNRKVFAAMLEANRAQLQKDSQITANLIRVSEFYPEILDALQSAQVLSEKAVELALEPGTGAGWGLEFARKANLEDVERNHLAKVPAVLEASLRLFDMGFRVGNMSSGLSAALISDKVSNEKKLEAVTRLVGFDPKFTLGYGYKNDRDHTMVRLYNAAANTELPMEIRIKAVLALPAIRTQDVVGELWDLGSRFGRDEVGQTADRELEKLLAKNSWLHAPGLTRRALRAIKCEWLLGPV